MRRSLPFLLLLLGCSPPPVPTAPEPRAVAGLHNLHRVSPVLWSGSQPESEAGFASLKRLGVKTVISVDGATPDVAGAAEQGLRYVHLPVGYDGIPRERALELAKAVRDLPGPVYVHCHHGQHRGPAAVAAIRLCLDPHFTPEQAEAWLNLAGTDSRYKGLVELPRTLQRPTAEELDRGAGDFPSVARVPDLARRMVEIDRTWDELKAAKEAGWPRPVEAAGAAVLLVEHYREVGRLPQEKVESFARLRAEAEVEAGKLERALRRDLAPQPPLRSGEGEAEAAFAASKALCQRCHDGFRDRAK